MAWENYKWKKPREGVERTRGGSFELRRKISGELKKVEEAGCG